MNAVTRPLRVADLATRRLSDEETVVLAPTGSAVILNEVGAVVLDLCDGSRTVEQIANIVSTSLEGANEERVQADVRSFVLSLSASGCVVEAT